MFQVKLNCAIHLAHAVIRADARGDAHEATRVQAKLADLIESYPEPDVLVVALARKLGRVKARMVEIDEVTIEVAARMPADEFSRILEAA